MKFKVVVYNFVSRHKQNAKYLNWFILHIRVRFLTFPILIEKVPEEKFQGEAYGMLITGN